MAYQGMEYGVDNLRLINESVAIAPDIAFYLRIDPKTSFERKGEYSLPFLNKVVAIYDEMEFDYWRRIDAEQSVDSVFSGIKAVLEEGR
jgi:thymidylate kinase